MLRQRILSALVLIPIVLGTAFLGGWAFTIVVAVATLLAAREYFALMMHSNHRPSRVLGMSLAAALVLAPAWPETDWARPALAAGLVLSLLWQLGRSSAQRSLSDWALTVAGAVYIGWLASFLLLVRGLPQGLGWILIVFLGTWANDTSAYLTGVYVAGRFLNRHLFAPTVSPKKTWEGSIAGWLACTVVTALITTILGASPLAGLGLGALLGIAATLGDLAVSFIKRQVNAKDSSHLIPGHGGMLDRIDSLLFVGTVVYYFVLLFCPLGCW